LLFVVMPGPIRQGWTALRGRESSGGHDKQSAIE
jgi:hypothetical protein